MKWLNKHSLFIKMLKYFFAYAFLTNFAFAEIEGNPVSETVLLRSGKNLTEKTVELDDLVSSNSFD